MSNKEPNNHLNVFFAYRDDKCENQLTRGLLVLLRLSRNIFDAFYEYLIAEANKIEGNSKQYVFPDTSAIVNEALFVDTQTSTIGQIGEYLLMVGIVAATEKDSEHVAGEANRRRIYDGIISVGNKFSVAIESKLCDNIADVEQLKHNLKEKYGDYTKKGIFPLHIPVILEWNKIIRILHALIRENNITDIEVSLIQDFLQLIDKHHHILKPFDSFSVCGDNSDLLEKRIRNIVEEVVSMSKNTNYNVKHHQRYAWKIELHGINCGIQQIDFPLDASDTKNWTISISLQFGVNNTQLGAFYKSNKSFDDIQALCTEHNWESSALIHIGFAGGNNVHIDNIKPFEQFYYHWKNNIPVQISPKQNIFKELDSLINAGFAFDIVGATDEINRHYMNTEHKSLGMFPTIAIDKRYSKDDLIALDEQPKAVAELFYNDVRIALDAVVGFKF